VCCSVLQCVAACGSGSATTSDLVQWWRDAVWCSVLQCAAVW